MKLLTGFTIVESVVVLVIVSVIATLILANYRSGQQQLELRQAAAAVADVVRRAQSHALSGTSVGGMPTFGYGARFSTTSQVPILYADKDAVGLPGSGVYNAGTDELLPDQPPALPSSVSLTIRGEGCPVGGVNGSTVDVVYRPPLPTTTIRVDGVTVCSRVCILPNLGGREWRVRVLRLGPIETSSRLAVEIQCPPF